MSEELKLLPCPFCGCNPVPPTSNYITVRCAWCGYEIPTEKWNRRSIPELPRVSPENLVEGEWYVVGDVPTWYYCGRFHTFFKDGTSRIGFWPEEGIHGPLKFRIGGAE